MVHPRRSHPHVPSLVLAGLLALAALPVPALAQTAEPVPQPGFRPRIVRAGTVALYGAGLYGKLLGGGRFADAFDSGLGIAFALRYRNSQESAFGLAFEAHRFDAKFAPHPDSGFAPVKLQMVMTTLDYYRHFNVRSRTPRYVVIGAGLMQSRQEDQNTEKEFPGDGGVFKVGGGLEYWVNRSLTVDLGLRYYGVLSESSLNHDVQVGLGLNFYTSP
jgi:opacity protein-like surface antigen